MIKETDISIEPVQFEKIEDPEERGQLYFQKHELLHILQELAFEIAIEQPEEPRGYMVKRINDYIMYKKSESFDEKDSALLAHKSDDIETEPNSQSKFLVRQLDLSNNFPTAGKASALDH